MTDKFNYQTYESKDNFGQKFIGNAMKQSKIEAECVCHRCIEENNVRLPNSPFKVNMCFMILCPICGNKRCPHASDHRLACTNSNDVGQKGSIYE